VVTPAARREAVRLAGETYGLSERRGCRLIGAPRATVRYRRRRTESGPLRDRVHALAALKPKAGYRMVCRWLRREGWRVNPKRIHRLFRLESLTVRRRRRKRVAVPRVPLLVPTAPNVRWSMDFMRDTFASGRAFRTFNVVDDATRECLAIEVDRSLPGARVVRVLDRLLATRGRPQVIVCDNELPTKSSVQIFSDQAVRPRFRRARTQADSAAYRRHVHHSHTQSARAGCD
jgi:putative transposase